MALHSTGAIIRSNPPFEGNISEKPRMYKLGRKWLVEHQHEQKELLIDETNMNEVVYMYKCSESFLRIKGKINTITMDSCRKTSLVFDSVVASMEFINCQSVEMQVLGTVGTISIDNTSGCKIYLSRDSLDVEITSSKSNEMNIMLPKENGEYIELAIPEQCKTVVNEDRKSINTCVVENKI
ncbi:adenylyl cyclase-associated protein [Holotrichia oblita]|uniref:Adenylyl cyclase-associated protein n=1 Tax=Holotrichia oblita TaxID=644536 RepID=A0ACB9TZG1_HOLOL|nr:adenylyl cyclase-associated protein [Holotrichia oblita]